MEVTPEIRKSAMSGFAAINGEPDGPPLLPPIALTDEGPRILTLRENDYLEHGDVARYRPKEEVAA